MKRIARPTARLRRHLPLLLGAVLLLGPAGSAWATEIEIEIVVDAVNEDAARFDSFPAHLLSVQPPPAAPSPRDAEAANEADLLVEAWTFAELLERTRLHPIEMEQNVRVNANDVLVKFRAPGGRRSFATVELIF